MKILLVISIILLTQYPKSCELKSTNSKKSDLSVDPRLEYTENAVLQRNRVYLEASISNGISSIQQIQLSEDEKYIVILKVDGRVKNCKIVDDPAKLEDLKSQAARISKKNKKNGGGIEMPKIQDLEKECEEFQAQVKPNKQTENMNLVRFLGRQKYKHSSIKPSFRATDKSEKITSFTNLAFIDQSAEFKSSHLNFPTWSQKLISTNYVTPSQSTTRKSYPTSTTTPHYELSTTQTKYKESASNFVSTHTSPKTGFSKVQSTDTLTTRKSPGFSTIPASLSTRSSGSSSFAMTSTQISKFPSSGISAKQSTISGSNTPSFYYSTKQGFSDSMSSFGSFKTTGGWTSSTKIGMNPYSRKRNSKSKRGKDIKKKILRKNSENFDLESKSANDAAALSRQRRFIYPGTRWCGAGNVSKDAEGEDGIGVHAELDRCCRQHDKCAATIERMSYKYSYFNFGLYTLSHCECDSSFRTCLRFANTRESNEIGDIFFNKLAMKCFILKQERYCSERNWSGSCAKYSIKNVAEPRKNAPYTISDV